MHPRYSVVVVLLAVLACATFTYPVAADTLCALRSGPTGPCTCRTREDVIGQFTVVDRSRCRPPKGKAARAKARATVAPSARARAPVAPAARARATVTAPAPASVLGASPAARETPKLLLPLPPALSSVGREPPTTASVSVPSKAPASIKGTTLDRVRARGKLLCGVNPGLLGFAQRADAGDWVGLDVDFCRAVAVAVLGDAKMVEFVPLDAAARFDALKSGTIDLLSRNTTWTMSRDVGLDLEFAGVIYFDGQSFITTEERGLVSAQQLAGVTICVQAGTTTAENLAYYLKVHDIQAETLTFGSREDLQKAYLAGECGAYTADRSSLFADRAGFPEPGKHVVLPEVISKEPLGPAVPQDDQEWVKVVRWTLAALINAEEVGLDRKAASSTSVLAGDALRLASGADVSGAKLRLRPGWLRGVVATVGNYGEIYDANVGSGSRLGMDRGVNGLWKRGGILYAPPMW